MLLLELRNEFCTRKCLPWKSLKCCILRSLICIYSYCSLTTKNTLEIIYSNNVSLGSWNSGYRGLPRNRVSTPGRAKAFRPDLAFTQSPIQWVSAERQGCEANHSFPSSPEVKNDNSYTSAVPEGQLCRLLTQSVSSKCLTNFITNFLEVTSGTSEYFQ
jgi:hypothetical protein